MSTRQTTASAPPAPDRRRLGLMVGLLAAIGALVILVQLWGYGAWLLSSPSPVRSATPVPADVVDRVRTAELSSIIGASLWLGYVLWDWTRRRTLTWPLMWTVAWACVFWQEPLVNVRTHTFSFNRAFHNAGDWTTHLPFVPSTYTPLPEALILEGLVFAYLLPLLAALVPAYLRLLRRCGISNPVVLSVIAYLTVVLFDAGFELRGVGQGLLRYVEIGGPAIHAGQAEQWPVLEGLMIGAAWAFPDILTYLLRDHRAAGRGVIDHPRWRPGHRPTAVTLLAAVGALNLAFGIYNAAFVTVMHGDVVDQPPWLASRAATGPATAPAILRR